MSISASARSRSVSPNRLGAGVVTTRGDGADAHLQRRAVFDQRGDVLADRSLDRRHRSGGVLVERPIGVHEAMDPREGHQRIARRPRHALVDLGDEEARRTGAAANMTHDRSLL